MDNDNKNEFYIDKKKSIFFNKHLIRLFSF